MNYQIRITIAYLGLSLLLNGACVGQNKKPDSMLKDIDLERDANIREKEITIQKTDFQVLNGILLVKDSVPDLSQLKNTIVIKDSSELIKLGVNYPKSSYTFYNSETDPVYQQIVNRSSIPKHLENMNLPLIINGKLVKAENNIEINKLNINQFKELVFKFRNSPELSRFSEIVFGAICINY